MCVEAGDEVMEAAAFPGRQGRLAFAYLASNHHPVSRDELGEVVWGEVLPKSWERDLSAVISKIKALLVRAGLPPGALNSAVGCYELRLPPDTFVDLEATRPLVEEAEGAMRAGHPESAWGAASAAVNLARRPFLPGEEGKWIEKRREELKGLAIRALDTLITCERQRGELAEALRYAHDLLGLEPFREPSYVTLMQLHMASGNRAEALRTYERCRRLLGEELGVPPSPETEAAYLEILHADLEQSHPRRVNPPAPAVPPRGIVTLLFTDLVGSTELLEQLGSERAEKLRRTHFALLRDAVATRGGEEVKNLGDGLMVAFGSAVDAVECAVAMQQGVQRHNRRSEGPPLAVRIGLHVGEPIRDEGDYFGTPVVIAKRLCDAAAGGSILVSDLVRGLVGDDRGIAFNPPELVDLKGLRTAVGACTVAWTPLHTEAPPLPAALAAAGAFVGRRVELDRLATAVTDPVAPLVLVTGDAGIGKTRLVTQAANQLTASGAAVLYGRCDEDPLTPYQPFVEALAHAVSVFDLDEVRAYAGSGAASLARLVPDLDRRIGGLRASAAVEPELERFRLFEATAAFLTGMAADRPVALVLDDLHWADPPTLVLLRHLLHANLAGVTLIATYRDSELSRSDPLTATLPSLRRIAGAVRIPLRGLSGEETAELVGDPAPAAAVHEVTEGNPLFVRLVVQHARETGAPLDQSSIPEGVRDVIGRRLSQLSNETNQTLRSAAVVGRDFDLRLLTAVVGDDEDDVLTRIEAALAAGVVDEVEGAPDRYAFSHALMRETLLGELSASRRLRVHAQIADAIDELHSADPTWAGELARHACEAVPLIAGEHAAAAAARAGAIAFDRLAFEDAERHYRRALDVLDPHDDASRLRLLLETGRAAAHAGRTEAFKRAYSDAASLAIRLDRPDDLASAALGYTHLTLHVGGGEFDETAVELLERALEFAPHPTPTRVRLLVRLAAETAAHDVTRAHELALEAMQLDDHSDPGANADAMYTVLMTSRDVSISLAERRRWVDDLVRLGTESGSPEVELRARVYEVEFAIEEGDVARAQVAAARYEEIAEAHRLSAHLWFPMLWRAMHAIKEGRVDDAGDLSRAAFQHGRESQGLAADVHFFVQRMLIRREQDRLDELIPVIEEWVAGGSDSIRRYGLVTLGFMYAEAGRVGDAARLVEGKTTEELLGHANALNWLQPRCLLVDALSRLGPSVQLECLYRELLPFADRFAWDGWVTVTYGSVERFLGVAATALGRWGEAEQHVHRALDANARFGSPPWVAQCHVDRAAMLLQSGRASEMEADLTAARQISDALGLVRIGRLVRELGDQPAAASPPAQDS